MPVRKRITNGRVHSPPSGVGLKMLKFMREHGLTVAQCYRNRGGFGAHERDGIAIFSGVYAGPEEFLKQKGLVEYGEGYGTFRLTELGKRYHL